MKEQKSLKERIQKLAEGGKLKKLTSAILVLTTVFTVPIVAVACGNKTEGPSQGIIEPEKPPAEQVTISSIWNENFSNLDFSADIKAAQDALCDRAFPNENAQITNILFNERTNTLNFTVQYVENGKTKSGSIEFTAPDEFVALRGKDAKSIVYAKLNLTDSLKIDKDEEASKIVEIQNSINEIAQEIETAFGSVADMEITREKDPTPIETVSFDEIIESELDGYLGNNALFQEAIKAFGKLNYLNIDETDLKIALNNDSLTFYFNIADNKGFASGTYKNSAKDFEDLVFASIDAQKLLDKYFNASQQNKLDYEKGSSDERTIKEICGTIKGSVDEQKENLSKMQKRYFTMKTLAQNTSNFTQEQALQFALKLGYTEKQVVGTYVKYADARRGFDDENNPIFTGSSYTGYITGFEMAVLIKVDDTHYKLIEDIIYEPWYTNTTTESIYNHFLNGQNGVNYKVSPWAHHHSESDIEGIIYDYAETTDAKAQTAYKKVAEIEGYDVKLPFEMFI